ncbi:MAG TPA: hypothetical protein EYN79_07570 [Planctomycetes bacterium]|nr:hypothetical protein [Planctomycetota bacterium]HIN81283.1 hypothetical protein [Planctomycetota bacterium]
MKYPVLRRSVAILLVCMVLFTVAGCTTTETRHHPDGKPYTETRIDGGKTVAAVFIGVVLLAVFLEGIVIPIPGIGIPGG